MKKSMKMEMSTEYKKEAKCFPKGKQMLLHRHSPSNYIVVRALVQLLP